MHLLLLMNIEHRDSQATIPINYQYLLSAAIYKILEKGNVKYAKFLHDNGYGKGFKFFTFSQLYFPFKRIEDYLVVQGNSVKLKLSFHIPNAAENFIKGLFQSENIYIGDGVHGMNLKVISIKTLKTWTESRDNRNIRQLDLVPSSPIVCGIKNERNNYDYLDPKDDMFFEALCANWRNKIATFFGDEIARDALLLVDRKNGQFNYKSKLISIKNRTKQETKIKGWYNFEFKITAEERFITLLYNAGAGLYNAQGMGFIEPVYENSNKENLTTKANA